jgi:hypothetical protein
MEFLTPNYFALSQSATSDSQPGVQKQLILIWGYASTKTFKTAALDN